MSAKNGDLGPTGPSLMNITQIGYCHVDVATDLADGETRSFSRTHYNNNKKHIPINNRIYNIHTYTLYSYKYAKKNRVWLTGEPRSGFSEEDDVRMDLLSKEGRKKRALFV